MWVRSATNDLNSHFEAFSYWDHFCWITSNSWFCFHDYASLCNATGSPLLTSLWLIEPYLSSSSTHPLLSIYFCVVSLLADFSQSDWPYLLRSESSLFFFYYYSSHNYFPLFMFTIKRNIKNASRRDCPTVRMIHHISSLSVTAGFSPCLCPPPNT